MREIAVIIVTAAMLLGCAVHAPLAPSRPLLPLHEDWRVETEQSANPSARLFLATDGESAFVATASGTLRALDPVAGMERWRLTTTPGALAARPGLLVLKHGDGSVDGLDPRTGAILWATKTGITGELAPLVTDQHVVLVGRGIALLDASSGEQVWSAGSLGPFSTPALISGEEVLAGTQDGTLHCLELSSGKPLWSYRARGPWACRPVVDEKRRVFVGTSDGRLLALTLTSGRRLWEWRVGAETTQTGAIVGDRVVFGSLSAALHALRRGNGDLVWRSALPSRPLSDPIPRDGAILVACYGSRENQTTFVAVNAATGKRQGVFDLAGELAAPPLLLGSRLVVALRDGTVVGLAPAEAAPALPSPSPGTDSAPLSSASPAPGTAPPAAGVPPRNP